VPVYLPALNLLSEVYSSSFLEPLTASSLPRAAICAFAHQLLFRAGSSNVRAREESSTALLNLARCEHVGCPAIARWLVRPLQNSKSSSAAVGRLELLRAAISEFELGAHASGLELREVLAFSLPLAEAAAANARDAAIALLLDLRSTDPPRVEAIIEDMRPAVLGRLKERLAPTNTLAGLSISGRKLPPLTASSLADGGEETMGTPPGFEARAKARQAGVELGLRSPPGAHRKKPKGKKDANDMPEVCAPPLPRGAAPAKPFPNRTHAVLRESAPLRSLAHALSGECHSRVG
jgi:hypothetical protein